MTGGLDRKLVARGAALVLAILVPPVVVIRSVLGPGSDSRRRGGEATA